MPAACLTLWPPDRQPTEEKNTEDKTGLSESLSSRYLDIRRHFRRDFTPSLQKHSVAEGITDVVEQSLIVAAGVISLMSDKNRVGRPKSFVRQHCGGTEPTALNDTKFKRGKNGQIEIIA